MKFPWHHQIVDDFFDEETFSMLKTSCQKMFASLAVRKGDSIDPVNAIEIKHQLGKDLYDKIFFYNGLLLQHHREIFDLYPSHRSYPSYYSMPSFHFISSDAGWHHIHDETIDKSLSIVLYIDPAFGRGTRIYNGMNENDFCFEVEWKPNRALIFCGESMKTWHSFGTERCDRITLNFFLRKNELPDIIKDHDDRIEVLDASKNVLSIPKDKETKDLMDLLKKNQLTVTR